VAMKDPADLRLQCCTGTLLPINFTTELKKLFVLETRGIISGRARRRQSFLLFWFGEEEVF
jgi:hypothetical protein